MSDIKDFRIENDILVEYTGNEKEVMIPEGVTRIGKNAFENCTSLTSITLPEGVTRIESRSFECCPNLASIKIPEGVTYVGISAFENCISLTSIIIPQSVTRIGESAFSGCTNLADVTILNSKLKVVKSVFEKTKYAFNQQKNSNKPISAAELKKTFGFYEKEDGTLAIYSYKSKVDEVVFPSEIGNKIVSEIGHNKKGNPFDWSETELKSVVIPDTVTTVGSCTFAGCTSLTSITISDNVTSIGDDAFDDTGYYNDGNNWDNGVLYIGNHLIKAKKTVSGDYKIKNGTKSIAPGAFYGCSSLNSVTIPDGVVSIGESAFDSCTSLASITISDSVTSIGQWAFENTGFYEDENNWEDNALYIGNHLIEAKSTIAGDYKIKEGTKSIAPCALLCCDELTSITIPDSVTSIDESAFEGCNNLTIHAPAGSYAEEYAKENNIKFIAE